MLARLKNVARPIAFAFSFALTLVVAQAAPRYESASITVTQSSATAWQTLQFSTPFTSPPVVVAGPPTYNGADGATVRLRNVTASGFEYQLDEWDYLDGVHPAESFSYFALEPGTHQIGGLTWQAGRIGGITDIAQTVTFVSAFGATPIVIAQAESVNNAKAINTRARSVTTTNFALKIHAQESDTAALTGESVGYIAITPGAGSLDGAPFLAGRTGSNVTHAWKTLTFGLSYRNPAFFAQTQSNAGADPFAIRRRNLTATGVEFFLQEEQSLATETSHSAEDVGYLVFGETQGELRAKLEVGALAQAQVSTTQWNTVTFDQPYASPVIVFGPAVQGDGDPVTVRVRNVTTAGFDWQLDEWDYSDGVHSADTVHYLVAEAGIYNIGGKRWEFGRVSGVTQAATAATFGEAFSGTPIVFAQVGTTNEAGAVRARLGGITTAGFNVRLNEEEAADGTHAGETVHYVAIEPGSGRFASNQFLFEALSTAASVTHSFGVVNFTRKLADPFLLADSQTRNEADPVVLRYRNLKVDRVDLRLQEEISDDPETNHVAESAAVLVIASVVDQDEDGIPDAWETANGLNPNNPNDGALDTDGDGVSNLDEYRAGTDPQGHDTGGTVSVQVLDADAYEKEGSAARFLVSRTGGAAAITVGYTLGGNAALNTDYTVKDANGATLSGFITLPAGVVSSELFVTPVADALIEYPETVSLALGGGSGYSLCGTSSGSVRVNDAAPTAANEQLFVAFLTRQGNAQTYASGIATLYLNGPKNAARVNISFSGLTSNQTNAYLRYGVTSGVGPELRPTFPIGQVTEQTWSIVPVGVYTGQNIIDALFQVGGKYTYVNIGTGNYPAGEISGIVAQQNGSTTFTPPPAPPALPTLSGDALTRDVARFLTQATFGPSALEIDALVTAINTTHGGNRIAGYTAWIDQQFAKDQTKLLAYTEAADAQEWSQRGTTPTNFTNNEEPRHHNRRRGWWTISSQAHDQLRQRLAFALSEIFVVSEDLTEVRNRHYGLANYYDQLGARADSTYRALLEDVSKSPMMAKYLSHLQNQKAILDGSGNVIISPDENYAREILQLFSIGLVNRHPDGTLKLGADGLPIPTYTQNDITELARVFTGWSFSKRHGSAGSGYPVQDNTTFAQAAGPRYFQASWTNPLKNFAAYHDTAAKTVLGTNIAAGLNGEQDLDAALDIIANHTNVGPFISRQLIQRLVTSNPSSGYIYRVAQKFANNGSGVRGDLKAVVKAILLDYEARSLDVVNNVGYGKQKEPIVRYLQLLRAVGGHSELPLSALTGFSYPSTQLDNFPSGASRLRYPDTDNGLAQTPLAAPSVFNWFLPDFNPGGAIASAGLVGPELQITTETNVVRSVNYEYQLTHVDSGQGVNPLVVQADGSLDNVRLNRVPLEQIYDSRITAGDTTAQATEALLDHLDVLLLSGNLKARYGAAAAPNPRSIILSTVSGLSVGTAARVKELLYLVVTSPEYLHQK